MKKLLGILVLSLLWCNVGFADAASVKKACRDLGFEPGTELFLDCALKLMSQEKKLMSQENQSDQSITLKPEECSQYKKLHKKKGFVLPACFLVEQNSFSIYKILI